MQIPKNPMIQLQKDIESSKRRQQKRQDAKDLRNAGVYGNSRDHFLDEDGYPRDGIGIPVWFKNLSRAWESNRRMGVRRRKEKLDPIESTKSATDKWNQWCEDRVDLLGEECDPRKLKRKPGRPKLPNRLKKNPTKIRRSDQMCQLLADHGIAINADSSIEGFDGFEFMKNGRIKFLGDENAGVESYSLSVHQFIQDYL